MFRVGAWVVAKRDTRRMFCYADTLPPGTVTYRKVRRIAGDYWLYRRCLDAA